MEKSYKRSFSYMFSAKNWQKEAGILFAILFIINIFTSTLILDIVVNFKDLKHSLLTTQNFAVNLLTPVMTILWFFISGYLARCTYAIIKNADGTLENLPKWSEDFFGNFILGAKKYGASMAVFTLLLPTVVLLGIPFLIFLLIGFALDRIFCEEFHFNSYIKWGRAFNLIKNNFGLYWGIFITEIFLMIIYLALAILLYGLRLPAFIIALLFSAYEAYWAYITAFLEGIIGTNSREKAEII
jgi:hypothetical protein